MNKTILSLSLLTALAIGMSSAPLLAFRAGPSNSTAIAQHIPTNNSLPAIESLAKSIFTETMQPALAKAWNSIVTTTQNWKSHIAASNTWQWGTWAIHQPNAIKAWEWSKLALNLPATAIAWPTTKILTLLFKAPYINRALGPKTAAILGGFTGLIAFYSLAPQVLPQTALTTLSTLLTLSFSIDMVERLCSIVTAMLESRWKNAAIECAASIILGILVFDAFTLRTGLVNTVKMNIIEPILNKFSAVRDQTHAVFAKLGSLLGCQPSVEPLTTNPPMPEPQINPTPNIHPGGTCPKDGWCRDRFWWGRKAKEQCRGYAVPTAPWFSELDKSEIGQNCADLIKTIAPQNYDSLKEYTAAINLTEEATRNCMKSPSWLQKLFGAATPTYAACKPRIVAAVRVPRSVNGQIKEYYPNTCP